MIRTLLRAVFKWPVVVLVGTMLGFSVAGSVICAVMRPGSREGRFRLGFDGIFALEVVVKSTGPAEAAPGDPPPATGPGLRPGEVPAILAARAPAYECPVCGTTDPYAYVRCQWAGCTDGRDYAGRRARGEV